MSARSFSPSKNNQPSPGICDLQDLPPDIRRMLRVQIKELMHEIDEAQGEAPISLHRLQQADVA